ncbi:unnamed protein product [Closterium sp. NIES-54]
MGVREGQTSGKFHTERRCFSRLDYAWRAEFGDDVERPYRTDLRSGVAIFDLDYDAIISAMYALSFSAEGDCYRCVPPDPGIAAAALGASASGTPLAPLSLLSLHLSRLDWLTPLGVARTSMTDAAAPHFLWPFAVRYAAHQLNLRPRVSLPETSPTLRWTGKVRDTSADKPSARAIPCVFLGFVPDAPGWQFYHPTSHRILPSQDVTFDESVPFYYLFPYNSAPPPPPPLFLAPGPPPVNPLPPQGPAPSGVSQADPLLGTAPVQVAVGLGAAPGAVSGGAASGGAASRGLEPGGAGSEGAGSRGAEPGDVETEGADSEGAESGGVAPRGAASSGALGAGGTGDTGAGGAAITTRAGGTGGTLATGLGRARTCGARAAGTGAVGCAGAGEPTEPVAAGAGGAGAGGAGVGGPHAGGAGATGAGVGGTSAGAAGAAGDGAVDPSAGGTVWPRLYFVPLLQQVLGVLSSNGLPPPFLCPPPDKSQPPILPAPSPYTEQSGGLTERREPASCPVLPVCIARPTPSSRPPPIPGTHAKSLRPSFVPLCSAAASALVAELLDFAAACRLDYAASLVAESVSASPPSVGRECALRTDVLEDRQEDFECLAAAVPRFASMLLARDGDPDAPDIPTPRSYAEAITVDGMWMFRVKRPPGSRPAFKARYVARGFSQRHGVDYFQTFSPTPNMTTLQVLLHVAAQRDYELHSLDFSTTFLQSSLHEEIWLRRPPGFTGTFPSGTQWSLRRPVYSLREAPREWHDTLRTTLAALGFAPSTADPSLFLHTDTWLPPFYVLVYLGLQITRDRAQRTITLTQSHMVHQVLQRFGFQFSLPQPIPLSTSHSLSAPPSDESIEPSGPYPELVCCLMYLMTCTRPDLAYPLSLMARYKAPGRHRKVHWEASKRVLCHLCSFSGMGLVRGGRGPVVLSGHADASWVDDSATKRLSQGYTFSLGSGSFSWRSTHSSSVLSSSCEAEIYAGAIAAQELRWLTYLLIDLGEQPRFASSSSSAPGSTKNQRYLTSQRQDGVTLYAHAPDALQAPSRPEPLPTVPPPTPEAQADYARIVLARDVWDSRNAAAALALTELLPPTEAAHFNLVETAKEVYDAISACYSTPSSASLSRILMPFVFPDLGSFATVSDLATHLRSLVASYQAACTEAQLLVAPPPTWLAVHWVITRLPDRLSTAPVSAAYRQKSGKGGKKGGKGGGGGGGGGGGAPGRGGSGGGADPPAGGGSTSGGAGPQQQPQQRQCGDSLYNGSELDYWGWHELLRDRGITITFLGGGRTVVCTDAATGAVLAMFTKESRSGLYVLHTERSLVASFVQVAVSPQVPVSSPVAVPGLVEVSGQVATSCSCRSLAHPIVLWHHSHGHMSLPRLHSMASHSLVSALPRVFPLLPPSLAPPCTPFVAGRLRATPHSSSLRPATVPFQTLHLDVWNPAPTLGPEREHYFLVVVDDNSRATRGSHVHCLHSNRGGEFRSGVPAGLCSKQGIRQSWTLPESPQQNGVVECRIGLVMDIARMSMTHARAPHFLWPYVLRYAACLAARSFTDQSLDWVPWCWVASPSPKSSSQSPQQPSALPRQVTMDYVGVGAGGATTGGTRSGGARSRGAGARGAGAGGASSGGAGAGGYGIGGANSGGAGAGGAGAGGASSGGVGAGGAGTCGASSGGVGAGGAGAIGAGTEETGARGSPTMSPTLPPHRHDTRFQALSRLEREEQEQLDQERQEMQRLDQQQQQQQPQPQQQQPPQPPLLQPPLLQPPLFPPVSGLRALGLPSSTPVHSQSPTAYGPTFPPPDSTMNVFSPPQLQSPPPVVQHDWTSRFPLRAWPSSPLADLCTVLFCSPRRSLHVSVLPSPSESPLTVSSHPITDYYHAARPVVSRVLASLVTDPHASPSSVSALTAAVADFASTRRLDYATRMVAAPPPRPLSVGGESTLGCDSLEDRQFELEFLAAASPSLRAMLLSLQGDPNALDMPTPHTFLC